MIIHDLTLQEEQGIFCKNSKELYFNLEDENYDHSGYHSLAAIWVDEVMDEPEFKDVALEIAWDAYCSKHSDLVEEDGISFNFVLVFLKEVKRDDLHALYCCYSIGITSWSCILVVNEEFEIRDLA
jgi:hypothetical protein